MGAFVFSPQSLGQIRAKLNQLFGPGNIVNTAKLARTLRLFDQGHDFKDASRELNVVRNDDPEKQGWERFLFDFLYRDNPELHGAARAALQHATQDPPTPVIFEHSHDDSGVGIQIRRSMENIKGKKIEHIVITYIGPPPGVELKRGGKARAPAAKAAAGKAPAAKAAGKSAAKSKSKAKGKARR